MVLGQSKTDPTKYVAMKVVYLRSPDVLDDPEHLAILRRWGRSGRPHPGSKCCMHFVLPEHSCSACSQRLDMNLLIRTANQAVWPFLHIFLHLQCTVSWYCRELLRVLSVGPVLSQHPCTLLQLGPAAVEWLVHSPLSCREAKFLQMLHHPNIVDCYDVVEDEKQMVILMEWLRGGHLLDTLEEMSGQHYSEQQAAILFVQVWHPVAQPHQALYQHSRFDIAGDLPCWP